MGDKETTPKVVGWFARCEMAVLYPTSVCVIMSFYVLRTFDPAGFWLVSITAGCLAVSLSASIKSAQALAKRGRAMEPRLITLWTFGLMTMLLRPDWMLGWAADYQRLVGVLLLWLLPVNILSFYAAGANVHDVDQERAPSALNGTDVLYALGGVFGVGVARQAFSASGDLYALPKGVPYATVVAAVLAVVVFGGLRHGPWFFDPLWPEVVRLVWPN